MYEMIERGGMALRWTACKYLAEVIEYLHFEGHDLSFLPSHSQVPLHQDMECWLCQNSRIFSKMWRQRRNIPISSVLELKIVPPSFSSYDTVPAVPQLISYLLAPSSVKQTRKITVHESFTLSRPRRRLKWRLGGLVLWVVSLSNGSSCFQYSILSILELLYFFYIFVTSYKKSLI